MKSDLKDIKTPDDLFGAIRLGNGQKLEIGFDEGRMIPVRLLSAKEEAQIVAKATSKARTENLNGVSSDIWISYETMIAILREATSIEGEVGIPHDKLEKMTVTMLSNLFDQYVTINKTVNPNFQLMKPEEIESLVESIREKKTLVKDCFTWQLAAVGRLFLEQMLAMQPTDRGPGTPS